MTTSAASSLDELSRHAAFLRALARGILKDEHLSEDVVQQVFVQAILDPPSDRGALRAWLARVTHRLALNAARGEGRRKRRERAAARSEAVDDEAGVELAVQRRVLDAVAALREPYRSAVHLRYYRGWAPSRIARELDVPVKTVQARLTRAHRILRERLDRAFREERGAWAALLVPAAATRAVEAETLLGGLLMAKNLVVIGTAAVALGGAWLAWQVAAPKGRPEAAVLSAAASAVPVEAPGGAQSAPDADERAEARATAAPLRTDEPVEGTAEETEEDEQLEAAVGAVLAAIERSFGGPFDPGAVLDLALFLATHDTGPAIPEPDPGGRIIYPLRDLPAGVEAELQVGKNRKLETVLTLEMRFDEPREPWLLEGRVHREPSAGVTMWTNEEGELRSLVISTGALPGRGFPFDSAAEVPYGASLHTAMNAPRDWKLSAHGLRPVDASDEAGQRSWRGARWDLAPVLAGGPWPRVNDMERFGRLLLSRYEEIRARSGR